MIDIGVRDKLFSKYDAYVDSFRSAGQLDPMSQLKVEHSKRVAANAKLIADYNGFTETMIVLAEVCGLLHDVGRYGQLKRYGTFKDADSINHGEFGYTELLRLGWLEQLPQKVQECVLVATRLHNVREIPLELEDETLLTFLKLVRDSDKLDIYYVFYDAIKNNNLQKYPEIVHNLDLESEPTPSIVDSLLTDPMHAISYKEAKSMADFLLIQVQWSYDMHSLGSYKIMSERELLPRMTRIMPHMQNPRVTQIFEAAIGNVAKSLLEHARG